MFTSCSFFSFPDKAKITDGFTNKRKKQIYDNCEVTIPNSATFIDGYYLPSRDAVLYFLFEVPESDFELMISENWKKDFEPPESAKISNPSDFKDYDFIIQYSIIGVPERNTAFLLCTESVEGKMTVLLRIWRPKYH